MSAMTRCSTVVPNCSSFEKLRDRERNASAGKWRLRIRDLGCDEKRPASCGDNLDGMVGLPSALLVAPPRHPAQHHDLTSETALSRRFVGRGSVRLCSFDEAHQALANSDWFDRDVEMLASHSGCRPSVRRGPRPVIVICRAQLQETAAVTRHPASRQRHGIVIERSRHTWRVGRDLAA